jgi:hypothetical protein
MEGKANLSSTKTACGLLATRVIRVQRICHDSKVEARRDLRWDLNDCLLRFIALAWIRNCLESPEENRVGVQVIIPLLRRIIAAAEFSPILPVT